MRAEDLRTRVERRGDATVVRLGGVLGVDSSPVLRTAVLACLAAEPSMIVLDVSDLRHDDDVVLTVLPALAQHAAAWPGSAMTLAAAPPPLAAALDRMAVGRLVPVFPTTDAALADRAAGCAAGRPGVSERVRVTLPPLPDATAAARHLVGRAGARWGFAAVREIAELVVTELVSNVLRHAGTEMEVAAGRGHHRLHISVRDRGPGMPRLGGGPRMSATPRPDRRGMRGGTNGAHAGAATSADRAGMPRGAYGWPGDAATGADRAEMPGGTSGRPGDTDTGADRAGVPGGTNGMHGDAGGADMGEIPQEDGRGLLVVSALTRAWGCIPVPDGKVVWATIGN
jgi:anti-sigma regulatory factor (Ser/Thr protein kinase)/anti-anti-sigma regulatory factor